MITEDYVSFAIAKLLKEKGFTKNTIGTYNDDGVFYLYKHEKGYNHNHLHTWYSAPTLQMAMKWLRVVHNLEIYPYHSNLNEKHNSKWWFEIIKYPNTVSEHEAGIDEEVDTYEEACEVAIKYCLENLV